MFKRAFRVVFVTLFIVFLTQAPGDILAQGSSDVTGSSELLGTVVVSASRAAEQLREVSSNITVISGDQVELAAAESLHDILLQQGFASIDYGATSVLQIRGVYKSSNVQTTAVVLVLVNGRRTGVTDVRQISLDNVERIEIIRGPAAVQYGSSALGGVINVITKRGVSDSFSMSLEEGIGSWGLDKSALTFNGGYKNFTFSGGASYYERDSFSVSDNRRFPHTSVQRKNATFDIGYTFADNHRIGVSYAFNSVDNEWPTSNFSYVYEDYVSGVPVGYNTYNFSDTSYGMTYDGSTQDDTFDWSMFVSRADYTRLADYGGGSTDRQTQDIGNYGASLGYSSRYLDATLGFDYIRYKIRANYEGNNIAEDFGMYLSAKIKLFANTFFISLGGRYDDVGFESKLPDGTTKSATNFAPSIGVSYVPLDWLKLRANYSEGFRMPTAWEYLGGSVTATWGTAVYHPNPDLKPERSKTIEFGFDIDYDFFNASFTYFQTDWTDRIQSLSHPLGIGGYMNLNLESSNTAGFEVSLKADVGKAFDWGFAFMPYVNFNYMTKRKNSDPYYIRSNLGVDIMPAIPRWMLAYGITLDHAGIDLKLNVNAVHMGPTFYLHYARNNASSLVFKKSQMIALDLSIEKGLMDIGSDGHLGQMKLRLEVNNVLDSRNEMYLEYPGPGVNYYVGLKYVF
jgi:vitamin B12 transporter